MNILTTVENKHFRNLEMALEQTKGREFSNDELRETLYQSLELLKTMEPNPENRILQKSLSKVLDNSYRLNIVSTIDFFKDYFGALPEYESREKCFEDSNNAYYKAFGEYKYKDFRAFREALVGRSK
jgi:hypothetical protein